MRSLAVYPTVLEQVYETILNAICDGTLASGERLTQESVAEKLNVSRQPVGQALILLKSQGFVREAGRRGLMVAPLEPQFVTAIYQIRAALDQLAAALAAANADAAAIERGREILRRGEDALAAGSVKRLIAADMDFHRFIYELSGNRLIAESMNHYWNHLRRVMSMVVSKEGYRKTIWAEHRAILDAIAAGDRTRAAALARQHAESAAEGLGQALLAERAPEPPRRRAGGR